MTGIEGLKGREPVGCSVTVGTKAPGAGFPIQKDRFHIVSRRQNPDGVKPHLSAFEGFHNAAPEYRRTLLGNIVHATRAQCFEYHLKNQVGPNGAHPDMRPFCVGNGRQAERWLGKEPDNFKVIECPHDQCEFRTAPAQGKPIPCKPWMRFYFRLRWRKGAMPEMLAQFTSASWHTTRNFVGLFDYVERSARQLGLEDFSLFGFPMVLALTEQTKASSKARFPVVEVTPEIDPVTFFMEQRQKLRELGAPVPGAIAALTDCAEQASDLVYDDHQNVTVPAA